MGNRNSYLLRLYNITVEEWDFICSFYGNRCLYPDCEVQGDAYHNLTVDHVIPVTPKDKSQPRGTNTPENYQPLCKRHNETKKNNGATDYRPDKGSEMIKALEAYREQLRIQEEQQPQQVELPFGVPDIDELFRQQEESPLTFTLEDLAQAIGNAIKPTIEEVKSQRAEIKELQAVVYKLMAWRYGS